MSYQIKGSHTVSHLTCHIVWVTKYRYNDLEEIFKFVVVNFWSKFVRLKE